MDWTAEMDTELLKMLALRRKAAEIAQNLSVMFATRITRNMVIGRNFRIRRKHPAKMSFFLPIINPPPLDLPATYRAADYLKCAWPTGEGPYTFECTNAAADHRPYCPAHCAIAYKPVKKK